MFAPAIFGFQIDLVVNLRLVLSDVGHIRAAKKFPRARHRVEGLGIA